MEQIPLELDKNGYQYLKGDSGLARMRFAYGTCLAVPREVFECIGLFDERFFLQLEETDFHMRATDAGYGAICDPSIKIFHKESRAFGGTRAAIKSYYMTRNTMLLIEKNHRGMVAKLNGFKQLYWILSRLAALTEGQSRLSVPGFLRWLASRVPSASTVRAGIGGYLLRRFGKAPDGFREQLSSAEKSYAPGLGKWAG